MQTTKTCRYCHHGQRNTYGDITCTCDKSDSYDDIVLMGDSCGAWEMRDDESKDSGRKDAEGLT